MKKLFAAVLTGLTLALCAHADTFTDNNPADVYLNAFNKSYTGTWDLTGYGYVPGSMQVDSAVATFQFFDLLGSESFTVTWNGNSFSNGSFFGIITLGTGLSATAIGDLSVDGILSYTVTRNSGEFWLTNARLTAQTSTVPDGSSTAMLIGVALIAMMIVSRRELRAVRN
ncbi:MAG: hypothetical protein JWM88_758 [Verrucomicrobia bacterium]|nr:hypothetical protein [Verrucomicrobiota bacterium]